MAVAARTSWGSRQSVDAADPDADTVLLPSAESAGQYCWYAISDATDLELAFTDTGDGILATDGILGPFKLASAPQYVVGGTGDILVLIA